MLAVYTNQKYLLKTTGTTEISRLETVDSNLLDSRDFAITFKDNVRPKLELHVYTPDGVYLTGNHNTLFTLEDTDTNTQGNAYKHLAVKIDTELETLGISKGQYRLVYNIFDNLLGGFDSQKLFIKEISPSRRELRLQLTDAHNLELTKQLTELRDRWNLLERNDIFDSFILNFGFNETYQIINFRFDIDFTTAPDIFVKLYEPLPAKYGEKTKVFISEEIITPFLDTVSVVPKHIPDPVNTLAGPNFELDEYDGYSVATSFKSWNDLLSANVSTSQQLIDSYFSGSLSGIKLNIDYRYFDNFVHYSSAVERVKNFKYKLELIDYYSTQSAVVSNIVSGSSIVSTNLLDLYNKRNTIVSSFDDFEKYLFFESTSSQLYSFYDTETEYGVTSSITPWPKKTAVYSTWSEAFTLWSAAVTQWQVGQTNSDPYSYFEIQAPIDSDEAQEYYNNLLEIATIYDNYNIHKLRGTIPGHIQNSEDNAQYVLFIDMMGQHFDILWTYIRHLTSIHSREEHPKDGMPDEMLYQVAKSLGFDLLNGKSVSDLWKYSLGTDDQGNVLQNSVNGITSISDNKNTKEIWRRLVNNLPYILKSKGTSRSIKALLSCFGIPSTVLTIKEYGGPSTFTDNDHYPEYVHDVFHYAWKSDTGSLYVPSRFYNSESGSLIVPNTLEFRFKTDSNFTYNLGTNYNIVSSLNNRYALFLTKDAADDQEGTLHFKDFTTNTEISASNLQIFDDSWHTVSITEERTGSLATQTTLTVAKSLYGKAIYVKSSSFTQTTSDDNFIFVTSSVNVSKRSGSINFATSSFNTLTKFNGHYHEIRLWSGSLSYNTITEHIASPNTYTYNVDRDALSTGQEASAPYTHLLQRWTLANTSLLSGSIYQLSGNPNKNNVYNNTASLYFVGYNNSGSVNFEGFEETYYTPSPSLGGSSLYTNKVRIDSSSLNTNSRLNTKTRIEKSSYDKYSLDSSRLGIYFSPQTAINEDVFNQLGYFEIDDYIGNPADLYNDHYTDLNNFAIQYWKKYDNRNDFEAYFRALEIYDFTLFKYIKQLLPQRTNSITGLVIEPNVLERSKVKLYNKPVIENLSKDVFIEKYTPTTTAEYSLIETKIAVATSPYVVSDYQSLSGVIDNIIDVNRLGTRWVQHRYLGSNKLTESGSYYPALLTSAPYSNSNRVVYNTRISNYLVDANNRYTIDSFSLPFSLVPFVPKRFYLPSRGTYIISASYGSTSSSFSIYDGGIGGTLLDTVMNGSTYVNELTFNSNFFDIQENGYAHADILFTTLSLNSGSTTTNYATFTLSGSTTRTFTTSGSGIYAITASTSDTNGKFALYSPPGSFLAYVFITPTSPYSSSLKFDTNFSITEVGSRDTIKFTKFNIFKLNYSQVQDQLPTGVKNQRYDGSKLSGPGINIDSTSTIDGGPVVKVTKVNPNQIVFANNQITTLDQSVTGTKQKSI
jgi:hypothetical protein